MTTAQAVDQNVTNDAWLEADNAKPPVYTHFGKISIEAEFVFWAKGVRLDQCPPFDAEAHDATKKTTRIRMSAEPLPGHTNKYPHERVIPSFSKEWTFVTLPSIKALGVSAQDIDGKYAKYVFTPARKYTNKQGEEKNATAFELLELFDSAEAAQTAADELFGTTYESGSDIGASIPGFEDDPEPVNGKTDAAKDVAAQFIPILWASAGGDLGKMAELMASNPVVAEHFDVTSPEVVAVINS